MTVLHYLEHTAAVFPDKRALIDENGSYSFSELRENALSLAFRITEKMNGVRNKPILVLLPKCKETIVTFMAIAYSGNIYSPTDIKFPYPKIKSIIDVIQPFLYISDKQNAQILHSNGIPDESILLIEDTHHAGFDAQLSISKMIDTDPVYIFFTSGSTGVPKGVTITHRGIIDYIDWAADCLSITDKEVIGQIAPMYFDKSTLELYLFLKTGATLNIIPEKDISFPLLFMRYVTENNISFLSMVPTAICNIANQNVLEEFDNSCLRYVLFSGEVMPNKQLNYWRKHVPQALYANFFGPTEITGICLYYIIDRDFTDDEPLPIGFPCKNTDILLLDEQNSLIKTQDKQGEICVRGSSLSIGYWNAPEMTAERFCQNPIQLNYPELIYRTGDLAHYNDRNELMFDGRKDHQIKHIGHRIELGEIEAAARLFDGVSHVACVYNYAECKIVLFYTGVATAAEIMAFLRQHLPRYMLPRSILPLSDMPLTATGKIDRKQLQSFSEK